jgi:ABC-type Zn2+ transport system substrate-binding protein/surface adhesin
VDRDADAANKEKLKQNLTEFDDSLKDAESKINEQEKKKE